MYHHYVNKFRTYSKEEKREMPELTNSEMHFVVHLRSLLENLLEGKLDESKLGFQCLPSIEEKYAEINNDIIVDFFHSLIDEKEAVSNLINEYFYYECVVSGLNE